MVAFGKKLAAAAAEAPFDAAHYLDYESLKALLYDLQPLHLRAPVAENALSLAVAPATNAAAMPLATSTAASPPKVVRQPKASLQAWKAGVAIIAPMG